LQYVTKCLEIPLNFKTHIDLPHIQLLPNSGILPDYVYEDAYKE